MSFADRIHKKCTTLKTCLVAGFDPELDKMPAFLLQEAQRASDSEQEAVSYLLSRFCSLALHALADSVAAIKPNLAFFEQYGLAGLTTFVRLREEARDLGVLVIADAKRGDIANTGRAYSNAFLGRTNCFGKLQPAFDVDAVTVTPFVGLSSLEPFVKDCEEYEKGVFILVRNSNPDAELIQSLAKDGVSMSEHIARWIESQSERLLGSCGLSGLGAVVGATKPELASQLRACMPNNIFLIPGLGAQGASVDQALQGFVPATSTNPAKQYSGLVNVSRSLLGNFDLNITTEEELKKQISERASTLNQSLNQALTQRYRVEPSGAGQ